MRERKGAGCPGHWVAEGGTWDGEVGRDINVFNVEHYISLYMNVWLNLAAACYVDLLIVSLSSVSSVPELSASANE